MTAGEEEKSAFQSPPLGFPPLVSFLSRKLLGVNRIFFLLGKMDPAPRQGEGRGWGGGGGDRVYFPPRLPPRRSRGRPRRGAGRRGGESAGPPARPAPRRAPARPPAGPSLPAARPRTRRGPAARPDEPRRRAEDRGPRGGPKRRGALAALLWPRVRGPEAVRAPRVAPNAGSCGGRRRRLEGAKMARGLAGRQGWWRSCSAGAIFPGGAGGALCGRFGGPGAVGFGARGSQAPGAETCRWGRACGALSSSGPPGPKDEPPARRGRGRGAAPRSSPLCRKRGVGCGRPGGRGVPSLGPRPRGRHGGEGPVISAAGNRAALCPGPAAAAR